MKETHRTLVKSLNPHLVCVLCAGYYIDPTTIVECLHSFCRSCIVKYLETSRFCPICDVQLHKTRPLLSIRRDKILERLVYKIVPGLHAKEMARRALPNTELYLSPDDLISLVLQYHVEDTASSQTVDVEQNETSNPMNQDLKDAHKKFLKCPAAVTVEHLKKFLILKYNLTDQHQVEIFHASENLSDDLSLIDIAYCFEWKQTSPMELCFQILEKSTIAVPITEEVELVEDVDMEEDSHSVASSSLPFLSSKSISESDDASNTSLDSKPLFERLESEKIYRKRKRDRVIFDEEPEPKKSLFDSLLQSTTNNNENENKDFQESDEDYSKYEQDIEEIIEEDDDDDIGRLRISSNISEDEVNNDETTSQMFVIDEAIEEVPEEEKCEKVVKEKHWKSEGRNKRKSKKAKHHHHHKRRLSQSPPPSATIVHSPDRDIMKLKVKLNTLPGYRHKEDKHHRHAKHYNGSASSASSIVSSPGRSSYKEDDSVLSEQSCDSVALPKKSQEEMKLPDEKQHHVGDVRKSQMSRSSSQAVVESPRCETVAKEPLQQVRAVRTKPKQPAVEQQSNAESSHKMIIMPPSSITVSIITAEEKLKMEKDKTLMLTGNHDYENKRPSLEIVRVNGPPTTPPITVEVPKSSPKPKEQHHEEQPAPSRPKTKKPVPAVIPIKSAKPSITIIPQSRSPSSNNNNNNNNNNNSNGTKVEDIKTSVTISLENGSHNDSALDLSGKSSRKDGGQQYTTVNKNNSNNNNNNKGSSSHTNGNGGQYEPPSMRNLMTLSDTAVHIRNMMSNSSPSPTGKEQQQQHQQQQDAKKRYNNIHHNNNNNNHGGNGSCSPKRLNGNVPLRIPVPPTSGSFAKASAAAAASQIKPVKSSVSSRASDTKPKHGPPNQAVRHIPNPSVLLFRHHQQHLAQFAAAAANAAAVNNNNKRPNPPAPAPSRIPPHPMPAAIPLHTIRKMENLTKNIEKVAAGLSVKANALYKQNFIENGGRARLELPS